MSATKPRLLELFVGTGSVGAVFREAGWDVISLDLLPRWKPDICVDVLEWDYRAAYPSGYFHTIWASPPCTFYSTARTTGGPRNLELANRIVQRTLEIIEYFAPERWYMESGCSCNYHRRAGGGR